MAWRARLIGSADRVTLCCAFARNSAASRSKASWPGSSSGMIEPSARARSARLPLLYYRRKYRGLRDTIPVGGILGCL